MENIIFDGAQVACARIELDKEPERDTLEAIRRGSEDIYSLTVIPSGERDPPRTLVTVRGYAIPDLAAEDHRRLAEAGLDASIASHSPTDRDDYSYAESWPG